MPPVQTEMEEGQAGSVVTQTSPGQGGTKLTPDVLPLSAQGHPHPSPHPLETPVNSFLGAQPPKPSFHKLFSDLQPMCTGHPSPCSKASRQGQKPEAGCTDESPCLQAQRGKGAEVRVSAHLQTRLRRLLGRLLPKHWPTLKNYPLTVRPPGLPTYPLCSTQDGLFTSILCYWKNEKDTKK